MSHTYDVPRLPARMRTDRKTGARYRDGSVPQDVARPLFQAPLLFLKPLLIASLLIAAVAVHAVRLGDVRPGETVVV